MLYVKLNSNSVINQFKELDLSKLPQSLQYLYLNNNQFKELNLSQLPSSLYLYNNPIEKVIGTKPKDCIVYGIKIKEKIDLT